LKNSNQVSEQRICVRVLRPNYGEATRSEKFPNFAFHTLENL